MSGKRKKKLKSDAQKESLRASTKLDPEPPPTRWSSRSPRPSLSLVKVLVFRSSKVCSKCLRRWWPSAWRAQMQKMCHGMESERSMWRTAHTPIVSGLEPWHPPRVSNIVVFLFSSYKDFLINAKLPSKFCPAALANNASSTRSSSTYPACIPLEFPCISTWVRNNDKLLWDQLVLLREAKKTPVKGSLVL